MTIRLYVGGVALLALATGACAGFFVPAAHAGPAYLPFLLLALVALSEHTQVRHYMRHNIGAMNLTEGILAPLIVTQSGLTTFVVTLVGLVVANRVRGNSLIKSAFNVAMWSTCASVGSLVYFAIGRNSTSVQVGGVLVTLLVMSAVNQVLLSGVLKLASDRDSREPLNRRAVMAMAVSRSMSVAASLAAGLVLSVVAIATPAAVSTGFVLILAIAGAARANASLSADGMRLEGLQRATHALATALDIPHALPGFLAEAKRGFEVEVVELVLFGGRGESVVHRGPHGDAGYEVAEERHELAELLAETLTEPTHLSAGSGAVNVTEALERTGHQRAIAAPLRNGDRTIGMLMLYDRIGMEGFEAGELKIADALSRELVGFLERVTLLQAIEEERRKLADILGNTSDGIFSIESDGTITSWNAAFAAMTGYVAEEVVGTRHFALLRPRDAHGRDLYIERWVDVIDTPAGLASDMQIVTQSGESVWLSCSYSRIAVTEPGRDVLVVVARNVTQARELERLKDDFVAVVSHELRTPLVPIKGWAQTLLNRGDRLNDDQRRTAVQSILAQAQKLESLVLNILEASRIEAGRTDGDGVADVVGIAARIVEDTLASRPDRTLRLRPPSVPCSVKGSSVWVERAIANLIANAIKYSPDDEPVDVVISTQGDDVLLSVTDRGPGIAVDAQERIFDRFERLEETRKQTGTGLGLYITRRLARTMGGDVTVSSVPGAGSTFLLRLPVAPVSLSASTRLPDQRSAERSDEESEERSNVVQLH